MVYTVIFSCNIHDSQHVDYHQGYETLHKEKVMAIYNTPGSIILSTYLVRANSATGAILKFQKWQNNGHHKSWLLE